MRRRASWIQLLHGWEKIYMCLVNELDTWFSTRKRFCMHSCTIWDTILTNSWVTAEDLALFSRQAFYQDDFAKWIIRPPLLDHLQLRCSVCVWPCKNIFHIQVQLFTLFFNPTHKTESGIANRYGITNSKPPGPISMMGRSETLTSNQIIFITLFGYRSERKVHLRLLLYSGNLLEPIVWIWQFQAKKSFKTSGNFGT
jgi:hypothetical protein